SAACRALARFAFRDDRVTEGALLLEEVLTRAPGDLATRLALVNALVEEGWLHPAAQLLAGAPAGEPAPPALLRAQADLLELSCWSGEASGPRRWRRARGCWRRTRPPCGWWASGCSRRCAPQTRPARRRRWPRSPRSATPPPTSAPTSRPACGAAWATPPASW